MNMSNEKLDRISERVYNASFVVTVILIFMASIGTAFVRYLGNNCTLDNNGVMQCVNINANLILVPDNVFKFIKDVLWIFAIPQTVKLLGDKLPLIVSILREAKVSNNDLPQSQDIESGLGR